MIKFTKTAGKSKIKIDKKSWLQIGKVAGWIDTVKVSPEDIQWDGPQFQTMWSELLASEKTMPPEQLQIILQKSKELAPQFSNTSGIKVMDLAASVAKALGHPEWVEDEDNGLWSVVSLVSDMWTMAEDSKLESAVGPDAVNLPEGDDIEHQTLIQDVNKTLGINPNAPLPRD